MTTIRRVVRSLMLGALLKEGTELLGNKGPESSFVVFKQGDQVALIGITPVASVEEAKSIIMENIDCIN